MHCPKCSCARKVKNGIVKGKQRYRCSDCGCNYTLSSRYRLPESLRKQAIQLYLEGLGFRSIERILGVSNVTIMRWIRDAGKALRSIKRPDHWKIYPQIIPKGKHIQSKAQTHIIESFNAIIRHYLARFRRKTKCYSKSIQLLEASLALFFYQ